MFIMMEIRRPQYFPPLRHQLNTDIQAVELAIDYKVVRKQRLRLKVSPEMIQEEHIMGLGPQYSYTDLVCQPGEYPCSKEIPLWSGEQGAGRGEQPLTFFGNEFYPYAGGDAFTSYSNSGAYYSSAGYGVIVNAPMRTTMEFYPDYNDRIRKHAQKIGEELLANTRATLTLVRDHNVKEAKTERFGLVVFGRNDRNYEERADDQGEDMLAAIGRRTACGRLLGRDLL